MFTYFRKNTNSIYKCYKHIIYIIPNYEINSYMEYFWKCKRNNLKAVLRPSVALILMPLRTWVNYMKPDFIKPTQADTSSTSSQQSSQLLQRRLLLFCEEWLTCQGSQVGILG